MAYRCAKKLILIIIGLTCGFLLSGCGCSDLEQAVLEAAQKGDHQAVKRYLDQGVEPAMTCWCSRGSRLGSTRSLIVAAVSSGSWETVELLIQDKDIKDRALIHAILNRDTALAKKLAAAGAEFDKYQSVACISSAFDISDLKAGEELFNLVMELGADINQQTVTGRTVVMEAFKGWKLVGDGSDAYADQRKKIIQRNIRLVLNQNPDLDLQTNEGQTALMISACHGKTDHITILLERGAGINIRDNDGATALMTALRCMGTDDEYVAVVNLFHQFKADINIANKSKETCLMVAAFGCGSGTVRRLIDLGADVDARDSDGETALFKAVRGAVNNNYSHSRLKENEHCDIINQLVRHGADINRPNEAGFSPLALARLRNRVKIADLLESLGARDSRAAEVKN